MEAVDDVVVHHPVALLAIVVLVVRALWRPDAEHGGFLWAAVAYVIAASVGPAHGEATSHLATAGLVLFAFIGLTPRRNAA